ncbi:pectate lyase superfamily protein-domain-containing protein [Bombardia bombarda]|uniref:Pectate lyase superfamily protein-domain-containing protein n=1 Tax=Bombardia bombarda TaxID=252184 RepID=A0AA39X927_9PEZI|nr:pectate lyase superfamily protein-domain-containing protein [Bombardia bombarda]
MAVKQHMLFVVCAALLQCWSVLGGREYMLDNQHNYFKAAPDKGKQDGAVWPYSGSFDNYIANLRAGRVIRGGHDNATAGVPNSIYHSSSVHKSKRGDSEFWLTTLGPLGNQPLAPGSNYSFWRNVVDDYHADNTGASDTVEAINAAIQDGNRCGKDCGSTFTQGAIIYFPPGTYKICTPIIQLYYTQFIGDPNNLPIIKGCNKFKGIALIDSDPYKPGGAGSQWYINHNQFFRQIRNFVFNLTDMPLSTADNDQPLVPTGIHWQVSQATSLQNLVFIMPHDDASTHVGIFTENGSGGFVSDLTFYGGSIGWRVGSQQFTARNLTFEACRTAVEMIWDWGFNWQQITVSDCKIGFNISGIGGDMGQGTGSISLVDCGFFGVPVAILTNGDDSVSPNIVLENIFLNLVDTAVMVDDGATLLQGADSGVVPLWATGRRYNGSTGSAQAGNVTAPARSLDLLSSFLGYLGGRRLYERSRPQYETLSTSQFLVATQEGVTNDGTGDQSGAINAFLLKAMQANQVAYFPAGIYQVGSTVFVPTGSRVQGSSWSQIQGSGFYFSDMNNPQVMVQVGNRGDVGSMEIVEMLFTVKGPTAGAILMEWNTAADSQGSAAIWDSHFRVGGGKGTDLDIDQCPKQQGSTKEQCIAAALMLHVTSQASGYFENVWAWVADHDNDMDMSGQSDMNANQIGIYGARGMLIESQGPSWFYGTGSEHSTLYNYQLFNAKNIYLAHVQTETPYYQPNPVAPQPFDKGKSFPGDPSFAHCTTDACKKAWGLRIIDSTNVTVHCAGFYSFFNDYHEDCVETHDCQERILEVTGSTAVAIFNLFTVATTNIASGIDNTNVYQNDSNQRGFTTQVSVWVPLPGQDNVDIIYLGPEVWTAPIVSGTGPAVLVLPTSPLPSPMTIDPGEYTTSLEYGYMGSTTKPNGAVTTAFLTTVTTVVITIPLITVSGGMPYCNVNLTSGQTGGSFVATPSVTIPPIPVTLSNGNGGSTVRSVTLPHWPAVTNGPPDEWNFPTDPFNTDVSTSSNETVGSYTYYTPFLTTISATESTVMTLSFPATVSPSTISCPPVDEISFATPRTVLAVDCPVPTVFTLGFSCPPSKVVTFLAASTGVVTADCTTIFSPPSWAPPPDTMSSWSSTPTSTTATTPLPVWATWPPVMILPVTTSVSEPRPTDDGLVTPCSLWFFFFCIDWPDIDIKILGWYWILPPGIYPPGPPPRRSIQFPPGFTMTGTLPPWPEITIGPGYQMTYSSDPSSSCTTKTASLCYSTTVYSVTTSGTSTTTTGSSTASHCETVRGCDVTDSATATTSTTAASCTPFKAGATARLEARVDNNCGNNAIVYPENMENVDTIINMLDAYKEVYVQIQSVTKGVTAYFWVPNLDQATFDTLENSAYSHDDEDDDGDKDKDTSRSGGNNEPVHFPVKPGAELMLNYHGDGNDTTPASPLFRRAQTMTSASEGWQTALVSLPRGKAFQSWESRTYIVNDKTPFLFHYDDSAGAGQTVYLTYEYGVWTNHREFTGNGFQGSLVQLETNKYNIPDSEQQTIDSSHGSGVAAQVNGATLGGCKKCRLVYFKTRRWASANKQKNLPTWLLEHLILAMEDVESRGEIGKAVINFSWGMELNWAPSLGFFKQFYKLLKELDTMNVTIVSAAGNDADTEGPEINSYPAMFADRTNPLGFYLPNLIIVGAATKKGSQAVWSKTADYLTTYGPGEDVLVPTDPASTNYPYTVDGGTSFAAPQVAALVSYLRGLDSPWKDQLTSPASVKKMVTLLHRRFQRDRWWISPPDQPVEAKDQRPVIWNGQVLRDHSDNDISKSCVADYDLDAAEANQPWWGSSICPPIPRSIANSGPGESTGPCGGADSKRHNADGGTCDTIDQQEVSGDDGDGSGGQIITYSPGPTASPTCPPGGECGGTLCSGYYCAPRTPRSSGMPQLPPPPPPDYRDPKDPNNGSPVPTTWITSSTSSSSYSSTSSEPTTTTMTKPTVVVLGGSCTGTPQCFSDNDCSPWCYDDGTCQCYTHVTCGVVDCGNWLGLCLNITCSATSDGNGGFFCDCG